MGWRIKREEMLPANASRPPYPILVTRVYKNTDANMKYTGIERNGGQVGGRERSGKVVVAAGEAQ